MQEALRRVIRASVPAPVRRAAWRVMPGRSQIAESRLYWERHLIASAGPRRRRQGGRVLCYHSVGEPEHGVNDVSPDRFRRHIELAIQAGFRFVPASKIARDGGDPGELAVSFDDGLKSVLTIAAPILKEYQIPFIVFAVSNWSDMKDPVYLNRAMGWGEIEALLSQGAEVGSHSVSHPDFAKIDHQRAVDELAQSRDVIRSRLGFAPNSFAIPFGQSANWPAACDTAARAAGYEFVYAQAEETRPSGTVPRTFVTKHDSDRIFRALLAGKYDQWEEWF